MWLVGLLEQSQVRPTSLVSGTHSSRKSVDRPETHAVLLRELALRYTRTNGLEEALVLFGREAVADCSGLTVAAVPSEP